MRGRLTMTFLSSIDGLVAHRAGRLALWAVLRVWAFFRPKRTIGEGLVTRWYLTSRPQGSETGPPGWYLHRIERPDNVRAEHTHPWTNAELWVLRGGYVEQRSGYLRGRGAGAHSVLLAEDTHRITDVAPNTWTLFRAGPKHAKSWGFLQPDGTIRRHNT